MFRYEIIVVPEGGTCFMKKNDMCEEIPKRFGGGWITNSVDNSLLLLAKRHNYEVELYTIIWPDGTPDFRLFIPAEDGEVELFVLTKDELIIKDIIE